jgi:hypothetical protein
MSFLQNLWADLVDKRLLPVVAVLIAALIAVPVVLGRAKDPETPPPAESIASVDDITSPGKVTLDPNGAKPTFVTRKAKKNDPFARQKVKVKAQKAIGVGAGVGDALANAGGSSGGSSGGSGGGTATKTTPAIPTTTVKNVSLQFGPTDSLKTFANVEKFTPLPSESNPLIIYNGIVENGKSASFLVSSDATPSGEGRCDPDPGNCQTLVLSAGETEFFDVPSGTGGITQYELKILAVTSEKLASKAK